MESKSFTKLVFMLVSGSTIGQALPILVIPILTRLYKPEDFGVFALFVAITAMGGAIANGRYELAITQPKSDTEASQLATLSLVISTIFSFLLVVPCFFFNKELTVLFKNESISVWLYFVPLVVWLIGLYNVLNYSCIRYGAFKAVAVSQIYKSASLVTVQLLFGGLKLGAFGLVAGQILCQICVAGGLLFSTKSLSVFEKVDFKKFRMLLVNYKGFVVYLLPATVMNVVSTNFFSLVIPKLFDIGVLGHYSLAQRSLGAPSALVGNAISQVFLQQATRELNETGRVKKSFSNALRKLCIFSFLFFGFAFFIIEELLAFALGSEWRIAGEYAKILIPFFAVNFIVSALSVTDSILGKQYVNAVFNLFLLVGSLSISTFFKFSNVEQFLQTVSYYYVVCYVVYLYSLYTLVNNINVGR